jgi:hypothetical protein
MWVLLQPGDAALVPSPSYPIHIWGPLFAGADVREIPIGTDADFFENVQEAYEYSWPKPRVIVLSFPHNPTTMCVDLPFMQRVVDFARERYDRDKATYHVSATLGSAPPAAEVADDRELERLYLELWDEVPPGLGFTRPGRQILHCTFGSVLTDPDLGPALHALLDRYPESYTALLAEHFERHLQALQGGRSARGVA